MFIQLGDCSPDGAYVSLVLTICVLHATRFTLNAPCVPNGVHIRSLIWYGLKCGAPFISQRQKHPVHIHSTECDGHICSS